MIPIWNCISEKKNIRHDILSIITYKNFCDFHKTKNQTVVPNTTLKEYWASFIKMAIKNYVVTQFIPGHTSKTQLNFAVPWVQGRRHIEPEGGQMPHLVFTSERNERSSY